MRTETAPVFAKLPVHLALATLAGMGVAAMLQCQPALAQSNSAPQSTETVNPLADFQNQDNPDPFSDRGSSSNSMLDWVHRAMMGGGQSPEEFAEGQQESLNDAAAQFRKQQQELLRNRQQQAQPTTPAASPVSGQP